MRTAINKKRIVLYAVCAFFFCLFRRVRHHRRLPELRHAGHIVEFGKGRSGYHQFRDYGAGVLHVSTGFQARKNGLRLRHRHIAVCVCGAFDPSHLQSVQGETPRSRRVGGAYETSTIERPPCAGGKAE